MTVHSLFHSNIEEKGMIVSDVQRVKSNKTLQVQTKQEAHKAPCLKPEPIKDMQENIAPVARTRRSMEKKPCGDVGTKQDGCMRKALEMDFGFKLSTEDVMTNSNPEFGFTLSTEDVLRPRPRDLNEEYFNPATMKMGRYMFAYGLKNLFSEPGQMSRELASASVLAAWTKTLTLVISFKPLKAELSYFIIVFLMTRSFT